MDTTVRYSDGKEERVGLLGCWDRNGVDYIAFTNSKGEICVNKYYRRKGYLQLIPIDNVDEINYTVDVMSYISAGLKSREYKLSYDGKELMGSIYDEKKGHYRNMSDDELFRFNYVYQKIINSKKVTITESEKNGYLVISNGSNSILIDYKNGLGDLIFSDNFRTKEEKEIHLYLNQLLNGIPRESIVFVNADTADNVFYRILDIIKKKAGIVFDKIGKFFIKLKENGKKTVAALLIVAAIVGGVSIAASRNDDPTIPGTSTVVTTETTSPLSPFPEPTTAPFEETTPIEEPAPEEPDYSNSFNYPLLSDESNSPDMKYTKEHFEALVNEIAPQYGLPPEVVLAIICQESSGRHEENAHHPNGGIGLMQVQRGVWCREDAYVNYYKKDENGQFVRHSEHLEQKKLEDDVIYNIHAGCKIISQNILYFHNNPALWIQAYNNGYGMMHDILDVTAEKEGITKDEMKNDPTCSAWMEYTHSFINKAKYDPDYLIHILVKLGGEVNTIKYYDPLDKEYKEVTFNKTFEAYNSQSRR